MKINYSIIILITLLLAACGKDSLAPNQSRTTENGKSGSLAKMITINDYLYVINDSELRMYSLDNPQSPELQNVTDVGFGIETIFPFADFLFIGSTDGMYVYDITDPTNPTLTTQDVVQHITACDPVVANENFAFVTLNTARTSCGNVANINILITYDISNINDIQEINTLDMDTPKGLALEGDRLYVCSGNNGIIILDISNPQNPPQQIGTIEGFDGHDIIMDNGLMMVVCEDGLRQYDYSDPDNITFISFLSLDE